MKLQNKVTEGIWKEVKEGSNIHIYSFINDIPIVNIIEGCNMNGIYLTETEDRMNKKLMSYSKILCKELEDLIELKENTDNIEGFFPLLQRLERSKKLINDINELY